MAIKQVKSVADIPSEELDAEISTFAKGHALRKAYLTFKRGDQHG